MVANGEDPAAARRATKTAARTKQKEEVNSVRRVVETFLSRHVKPNLRPLSAREVERLLTKEALPFWGNRSLASITATDIHERMDQIIDRGAAVMANRFFAVFRKFCGWAVQRGYIATNPCAGIKAPTKEISRDRVLSDDELRLVWNAATAMAWPFGPIIQLLLLTGQRKGEVVNLRWIDINVPAKVWTIPKERAKNGQEHTVPLSEQALRVIATLPSIHSKDGLIFSVTTVSPVSGFTRAKERLDRLMAAEVDEPIPPFVLHDLRRSVASGMARLGVNLPVIEKVLNHTSGSFGGIVGVYQRHTFSDEKRVALDLWGRHVEAVVSGKATNVIELKAARS